MQSETNTGLSYELLIQRIYQELLLQEGFTNIEVKHDEDVVGMSGVPHQIDVLWRFRQAGIEHLVLQPQITLVR